MSEPSDPDSLSSVVWAIVGGTTAGTAAVIALFGWLGSLWMQRILHRERTVTERAQAEQRQQHEREMQVLRDQRDVAMRYFDQSLARQSQVSLARFEKEFESYQRLWAAVSEAMGIVIEMRSAFSIGPAYEKKEDQQRYQDEKRKALLEAYYGASDKVFAALNAEKPFMDHEVYTAAEALVKLVNSEAVDYRLHGRRADEWPNYWEKALANRDELIRLHEVLCKTIGSRLSALEGPNFPKKADDDSDSEAR